MAKKYTEHECIAKLTRLGCKFGDMNTFTVPKGKLGINSLAMVDFLERYCRMRVKYE